MRIRIEITRGRSSTCARRSSRGRKILLSLAVVGSVATAAGLGTYSAFTATTANAGNTFASGSVAIEDNDGGSAAMLGLSNAKPGDSDTSCIRVRYTGSLASTVKLYATVSGTLPQYLNVVVTRGSTASGFDNCTGFVADSGDYGYGANGILYSGTLQGFPSAYAAGVTDPDASWTNSEERWYRFVVTLADNEAAKNQTGAATFSWEARNQ
jgi:hypothetical protein